MQERSATVRRITCLLRLSSDLPSRGMILARFIDAARAALLGEGQDTVGEVGALGRGAGM